ncbi:MAG: hypothetical protein ABIH76_08425 [Candidatus Bathyarchaeota archaeon]
MPPLEFLAKIGSISLGCSFVAGNRRVPRPAEYNLVAIAIVAKFIFSHSGNNISGKNEH